MCGDYKLILLFDGMFFFLIRLKIMSFYWQLYCHLKVTIKKKKRVAPTGYRLQVVDH